MTTKSVVRVHIDERTKEARAVLEAMGFSVSDAFRMLLARIVNEKALPFELVLSPPGTMTAQKDRKRWRKYLSAPPVIIESIKLSSGKRIQAFTIANSKRRLKDLIELPLPLEDTARAAAILATRGLTVSRAFDMMLTYIAREKALPFEPLVSSADDCTKDAVDGYERLVPSRLVLSDQDRDVFLAALDNPPEPNEALRRAARRYAENVFA